jgi:hypothetical protein
MRPAVASAVIVASLAGAATAQTVVYSNGPVSTGATTSLGAPAPGGYTWSELQEPNSSLGFADTRDADDFTLAAAAQVQSIDVFAYVTNASTSVSPFTTATLQIWNGPPDSAASSVVFGNTTTNRFLSATPTTVLRTHASPAETTRVIWQVRLSCNASLPPGTYWLDWSLNTGSLAPVTIMGQLQKPGANGKRFRTEIGFWRDLQDGATQAVQDLAFAINGAGGGPPPRCYANCDSSTALPFLNVADFTCFLQRYAAGSTTNPTDPANCDGSTAVPILNVADFTCFLQKFAAGCSAP